MGFETWRGAGRRRHATAHSRTRLFKSVGRALSGFLAVCAALRLVGGTQLGTTPAPASGQWVGMGPMTACLLPPPPPTLAFAAGGLEASAEVVVALAGHDATEQFMQLVFGNAAEGEASGTLAWLADHASRNDATPPC